MKKLPVIMLVWFACLALAACKNPWVTELLKAPSELSALEVTVYAGEHQLQGGASFEPGFSPSKRKYTVYVPLEATRFTINAVFDGNGTVVWKTKGMDGAADPATLDFNFYDDEDSLEVVLTVQRENMNPGEYRLTVTRSDNIPPPKVIALNITPSVGTYFLNAGVTPVVDVEVEEPADGGTLAYQWFRNEDNNTVTGSMLHGQTGTSYTLSGFEIETEGTMYYYVEVTKTLDGKTSKLESPTRSVTFVDRVVLLDVKSAKDETYWVDVPAGEVTTAKVGSTWEAGGDYPLPWSTDGFKMGKYPVTFELWDVVRQYAEAGPYRFANAGNQGAFYRSGNDSTNYDTLPVGTPLHPVTMVGWRDAMVWCNALSEMEGREPVYCDSEGNALQDSRLRVEWLIDDSKATGKNGYRLPTLAEDEYAARGANPGTSSPWTDQWPGTNIENDAYKYVWANRKSDGTLDSNSSSVNNIYTGEVGSLLPNSIGLYDMTGMVQEYTRDGDTAMGGGFKQPPAANVIVFWSGEYNTIAFRNLGMGTMTYGLRVIRYEDGE